MKKTDGVFIDGDSGARACTEGRLQSYITLAEATQDVRLSWSVERNAQRFQAGRWH